MSGTQTIIPGTCIRNHPLLVGTTKIGPGLHICARLGGMSINIKRQTTVTSTDLISRTRDNTGTSPRISTWSPGLVTSLITRTTCGQTHIVQIGHIVFAKGVTAGSQIQGEYTR